MRDEVGWGPNVLTAYHREVTDNVHMGSCDEEAVFHRVGGRKECGGEAQTLWKESEGVAGPPAGFSRGGDLILSHCNQQTENESSTFLALDFLQTAMSESESIQTHCRMPASMRFKHLGS